MPIEIRELVIRVAVDEHTGTKQEGPDAMQLADLKNKIVKECIETIMLRIDKLSDR